MQDHGLDGFSHSQVIGMKGTYSEGWNLLDFQQLHDFRLDSVDGHMFCQQSTWKDLCFCPTWCLQCIVIIVEKSVSNGQTVLSSDSTFQCLSSCIMLPLALVPGRELPPAMWGKKLINLHVSINFESSQLILTWGPFLSWPELFAFAAGAVGGVAVPFTVATWCAAYRGILPGKTVASIQHLHAHPLHKYTCTYIYIMKKITIIIIKKTSQ